MDSKMKEQAYNIFLDGKWRLEGNVLIHVRRLLVSVSE
jgi:hypothetical protein